MSGPTVAEVLAAPVVVAPMGGGPSRPELVLAATAAGAFGFLAAAYKSAETMREEIEAVRSGTADAFGVNVFVPGEPSGDPESVRAYLESLAPDAAALGVELAPASWDDDDFDAKLAALVADPVAVVSFTFGCPSRELVGDLHDVGSQVWVTVTEASEARLAADAGADALCVQGPEAGAHRGCFAAHAARPSSLSLLELLAAVTRETPLPLIGAGAIMDGPDAARARAAGATAVQCGTAFLACHESGASPAHKAALSGARFTATTLTRAFSGRVARGLRNRFIDDHPDAPLAYPEINNATRPLRAAAGAAGVLEAMSLWAGEGFARTTELSAGEIVERLRG